MYLIWDITDKCNLSCSHCYNAERYNENELINKELVIDNLDEHISKIIDFPFERVHFLGGEPLLEPRIFDAIKVLKRHGKKITMVSNGTLLNDEIINQLLTHKVDAIMISLDGLTSSTHDSIRGKRTFDLTLKGIHNLINKKKEVESTINVGLAYTLTKQNCKETEFILEFCKDNKIEAVAISRLSCEGNAVLNWETVNPSDNNELEIIEKVVAKSKDFDDISLGIDLKPMFSKYLSYKYSLGMDREFDSNCIAGTKRIYMTADGYIYPCSPSGTHVGVNAIKNKEYSYTEFNIKNNTFSDIYNSEMFESFRQFVNKRPSNSLCLSCEYVNSCSPCPLYLSSTVHNNESECSYALDNFESIVDSLLSYKYQLRSDAVSSLKNDAYELLNEFYSICIDKSLLELITNPTIDCVDSSLIKYNEVPRGDLAEMINQLLVHKMIERRD